MNPSNRRAIGFAVGAYVLLTIAYTWPLAIVSALAQSQAAIALIAGFSTWIMVIFKPDGSHGMYSWLHVGLATLCAVLAWDSLRRDPTTGN